MFFFRKKSGKSNKYKQLIIGGLLVVLIPLALSSLRRPDTAQASWYNDNWTYRQTVALTNSGSAQTDFQVSITLDTATLITAGKMQSDCDDIRVLDNTGKVLPYWIETGNNACNTSTTAIWVKVPSISTTGNAVFVYYGNPSAISQQDGNAVFAFFDDFSGSSIDSTKWTSSTTGTASIAVTGGTVELSSNPGQAGLTGKVNITNNFILEKRIKYVDSPALDRNRFGPGSTPGQDLGIFWRSTDIQVYWNGAWSGTVVTASQYYRDKRTHDGSTFAWTITTDAGAAFYSNSISNTLSATQYPSMTTGDSPTVAGGDMFIDWIFARKYAATLPTVASPTNEEKAPGPVAYWKFDDGTGTTAQDSTTNNNDGTISGATWQTEDQCITGKCLFFDGSNDVVTVSNTVSGIQTVSLWIKPITTSEQIIDINGTASISVSSGTISATNFTSPTIYVNGVVSSTLVANTWQYVTVTTGTALSGSAIKIGQISTNYGQAFIDDVKIYPYARTAAQIASDFSSRGSSKGVSTSFGSDAQNTKGALSDGLVGYWNMNESSTGAGAVSRSDSSGNGNTLTDNATVTSNPGKFGNAGQFTRTNTEYLSITDNASLSTGDIDFTFSAWVYADTTGGAGVFNNVAGKDGNTNQREWVLYTGSANPVLRFAVSPDGTTSGNGIALSSTTLTASTWYFVVAWHDSINNTVNIQVNNGAVDSTSYSSGTADRTGNFQIGANIGSQAWDGRIDEARFYKRVLSAADRTALYNFAPGPVGYWNMDENTGTSANDRSGNGNTGTWNGTGSHWKAGKYGSSGNFNGSDDYIALPDEFRASDTAGTVEGWFKINQWTASRATIFSWGSTNAVAAHTWNIRINNSDDSSAPSDGNAYLTIRFVGNGITNQDLVGSTLISRNNWYHFSVTGDGSTYKMYIDGILQTLTAVGGAGANSGRWIGAATAPSGTNKARLGDAFFQNAEQAWINGLLDDVRYYNYPRTQKQIISDMNAGHPAVGSPVGSAIGHWDFDEGADNTCIGGTKDACNNGSGGSAYDGTQSGMATPATATSGWTQNGKFGKALSFDGTDDYVNMGNLGTVPTAGTISFWMKFPTLADYPNAINIVNSATNNNIRFELCSTVANCSGYQFAVTIGNASTQTSHKIATTLSTNTWYYVSATWNQTTNNVTTYLNGKQVVSESHTAWPTNSMSSFTVGAGFGTRYWSGQIDEVKLYNYDLTADQVKLDMNKGQAQVMGALSDNSSYQLNAANQEYCVPGDTTSCAAPVSRWDFEEGTGSTVNDRSGNANTGTWAGTLGSQWKPGKYGSAGNFNGSNYVTKSSPTNLNNNAATITFWVKSTTDSSGSIISLSDGAAGLNDISIGNGRTGACTNELITFARRNDADSGYDVLCYTTSTRTELFDGGWKFIALTASGSTSGTTIYINGVAKTVTTGFGSDTGKYGINNTINQITIGAKNESGVGNYATATIDDVKIYNYARTPAQISWDYNRGAPVGHWDFDECQGTSAYDLSGNGNTGTITPGSGGQTAVGTCTGSAGTLWADGATGKYNSSLDFDGTDDYVQTSRSLTNTTYSISAWIYPSRFGDNDALNGIYYQGTASSNVGTRLAIGTCSSCTVASGGGNTSTVFFENEAGTTYLTAPNSSISLSTWNHVVITKDGANEYLYINGKLANSRTNGNTTTPTNNSSYIGFWYLSSAAARFFQGQIDDTKIYNYALTATQVKGLYTGGAVRFGPVTGTP